MFFKPVFSVREQSVNVSELTPVGTVLARVHATDADDVVDHDALSYRLAHTFALPSVSQPQRAPLQQQHQHQNDFAVDERTGAVLLRQTLDYERSAQHVLLVEAVDSALIHTATASLVVHVRNENDNPPAVAVAPAFGGGGDEDTLLAHLVAAAPTSGSTSSVVTLNLPENALEGTQVGRVLARDPDFLSGVQCSLNDTLHFKLVRLTTQPSNAGADPSEVYSHYTLQVTALAFDREALSDPVIHARLTCTEVSSSSSSSSLEAQAIRSPSRQLRTDVDLRVLVWDVNDASPEFEQSTYSVSVPENVPVGSLLLELRARDRDADPSHSHVIYRLGALDSSHNPVPVSNWFAVDTNSGALVTRAALDLEAITNMDRELQTGAQGTASGRSSSSSSSAVLRLLVIASDGVDAAAGSAHSATATVLVHVQDVDDCAPKFERDRVALVVSESAPPGTLLGTFAASDCDVSPAFRSLQYLLSEDGAPEVQSVQSIPSSQSQPQHDAILKDTRSERFAVDTNGTVTLLGALNFSRQQSHTLNLVARDTRNRGLLRIAVFVHPNDSSSSALSPVALLDAKDARNTRTPASGPAAPNAHQHQQQAPTGPESSASGQQSLRVSISLAIGCAAGVLLVALVLCALWFTVLQRHDDIFYICRCRRHRRSRQRRARGGRAAGASGAGPQPKEGTELMVLRGAHAELGLGLEQVEDPNDYGDGDGDGEEEEEIDADEHARNQQEQHKSASRSASQQMHALYLLSDDLDRGGELEEHRPLTRPSPSLRMEMSDLFATGNRFSTLHIFMFSSV